MPFYLLSLLVIMLENNVYILYIIYNICVFYLYWYVFIRFLCFVLCLHKHSAVMLSACYRKDCTKHHKAPRWKLWSTSSMAMRRSAQQWTILLRCSIHMEQHCFQVRKHMKIERLLFWNCSFGLWPDLEREDCISIVDKSIPFTVASRCLVKL